MNVLKPNNRFSSLLEDNRPVHNRHVNESRYINKYKTDIKSIKNNTNSNINMNDFPALIDTQSTCKVGDVTTNYVNKVLHQTIIEPEKGEVLPYGWIVITPNKYKHNVKHNVNRPIEPSWENALDSLVKLYNKRKDEYIAMWGEETYEKVFLFPNNDYDYDYYDDEDETDDNDEDGDEYEYDEDEYCN
jgi:hypothetical protein